MKRFKAKRGNGFARYGIKAHSVIAGKHYRGGTRL